VPFVDVLTYTYKQTESRLGKVDEKVTELQDWLLPIKQILVFNFDSAIIQELVTQLKQYSDEVADLPKGMITTLRILKHLTIAPDYKDEGACSIITFRSAFRSACCY